MTLMESAHEQLSSLREDMSNVHPLRPRDSQGVFSTPFEAQQAALGSLELYEVEVVRTKPLKEVETTSFGSFYQETVRFSDGAVRELTRGVPDGGYFAHDQLSPYIISSGDPLATGPDGFNRDKIKAFVEMGYEVFWLHHQGRHAVAPTNREHIHTNRHFLSTKSIGRSAHHDHAALNHFQEIGVVDARQVIREGFSRSAMSGEAFIALGEQNDRETVWSDLDATCFARKVGRLQMILMGIRQIPDEILGVVDIAWDIAKEDLPKWELKRLVNYAGTFDTHPLNMTHEGAWIRPLVNGDAGVYAEAVPLDAKGIRTLFSKDRMSQQAKWEQIHSVRPGIHIEREDGPHVYGAHPEYLAKKYARFAKLMTCLHQNNMSLSSITANDVLPTSPTDATVAA